MKIYPITRERVLELLEYNPDTGVFFWKKQTGKVKSGSVAGNIQAGYRKISIDRFQIKAHRLAWFLTYGVWPSGQIDHIDGDKLNNRISNLRDVPMSINMQNRYAVRRKSDLPMGVTKNKYGRFIANIRVGTYDSAAEASEAFMRAKRLIHEGCTK